MFQLSDLTNDSSAQSSICCVVLSLCRVSVTSSPNLEVRLNKVVRSVNIAFNYSRGSIHLLILQNRLQKVNKSTKDQTKPPCSELGRWPGGPRITRKTFLQVEQGTLAKLILAANRSQPPGHQGPADLQDSGQHDQGEDVQGQGDPQYL